MRIPNSDAPGGAGGRAERDYYVTEPPCSRAGVEAVLGLGLALAAGLLLAGLWVLVGLISAWIGLVD